MLSPLRAERIWLEKICAQLAPAFAGVKSEDYAVAIKVGVSKKANAMSFRISLALTLTPTQQAVCRYKLIEIKTVGIFDLADDTPEERVKQLVPLNCLSILHGFARGVVAQITGLNEGGPVLLPTVNFVDALQKTKRKTKVGSASGAAGT